jgi:hypothetical protein
LSLELKDSDDNNFIKELAEFLDIIDNNEFDEEKFNKYLNFGLGVYEDEDWSISSAPARNYSTNVTFDGDDVIELANYLLRKSSLTPTKSLRCNGHLSTIFS